MRPFSLHSWLLRRAGIDERILLRPNVEIKVFDGDSDRVIQEVETHNLITDVGIDAHWQLIGYPSSDIPSWCATPQYIAVGTGATAPAAGDTELETEVFRTSITRRNPQAATHAIEFYLFLTTADANDVTLTEAGVFNLPSEGPMWARATYAGIDKTALVSVQYRWTWTYGLGA